MKKIPLTKGQYTIVDKEDFEELSKYNWQFSTGYASRKIWLGNGKQTTLGMHRMIMSNPDGMDIDHINCNKLDNRRINLRIATRSQNMINTEKRKDNTSGYKGVSWIERLKKWRAYINVDGKNIHLGVFNHKDKAAEAYNLASFQHFKEFTRPNLMTK